MPKDIRKTEKETTKVDRDNQKVDKIVGSTNLWKKERDREVTTRIKESYIT